MAAWIAVQKKGNKFRPMTILGDNLWTVRENSERAAPDWKTVGILCPSTGDLVMDLENAPTARESNELHLDYLSGERMSRREIECSNMGNPV